MIRRPPRSTQSRSSAASDVYKRQVQRGLQREQLEDGAGRAAGQNSTVWWHTSSRYWGNCGDSWNRGDRPEDSGGTGVCCGMIPLLVQSALEKANEILEHDMATRPIQLLLVAVKRLTTQQCNAGRSKSVLSPGYPQWWRSVKQSGSTSYEPLCAGYFGVSGVIPLWTYFRVQNKLAIEI